MLVSEMLKKAASGPRLEPPRRKRINNALHALITNKYFPHVPWDEIEKILDKEGVVPLQEDNTKWSGMFLGSDSKANIDLAPKDSERSEGRTHAFYTPYTNTSLVLMWHKMEATGRYEITTYVA